MTIFKGLSAFPITPCDAAGQVEIDALGRLVCRLETAGVNSIGLLGSTGTYAYLNRAQRMLAIETAKKAITDTPLIVGIGALRTDDVIANAKDAAKAGAQGLLLAPVSYTPLTQDEAFTHFKAVAGSTDLPICIYNNPGTTHFQFSSALLQRLAALPTVRAVKMPLPAQGTVAEDLKQLRANMPAGFSIGYSGDWGCADALQAGADAWYSVIGGILPRAAMSLTAAAQTGDTSQDAKFAPFWALFQEFGSLRIVYAMANQLGLTDAHPPRPLMPVAPDVQMRVSAALEPFRSAEA